MVAACPFCSYPYDVEDNGKYQCGICGCRYYVIDGQLYVSDNANRFGPGGSIVDRYHVIGEVYPDSDEVIYCCVDETAKKVVCLKDQHPENGYTAGDIARFMVLGEISVPARVGRAKVPGLKPLPLEDRITSPAEHNTPVIVPESGAAIPMALQSIHTKLPVANIVPEEPHEKIVREETPAAPKKKTFGVLFTLILLLLIAAGGYFGVRYYLDNRAYAVAERAGMVFSKDRTELLECQSRAILEAEIPEGVVKIADKAFSSSRLTSVKLPSSLKEIGAYAFYNCQDLKKVVIPAGVTKISEGAFSACISLESVTLPEGVTTVGNESFNLCSNLKTVKLPAALKSIGVGAFKNCGMLEEIEIPDGVEEIQAFAFSGCGSLESVKLPAGLKVIGDNSFEYTKVNGITLPADVTTIGVRAFFSCKNLTKIAFPASVKEIKDAAFRSCENLEAVKIGSGVEKIGDQAFEYCAMSDMVIPANVKSVGGSAFGGCKNLKSVTVQNGVAAIGNGAFSKCTSLESVKLPDSIKIIARSLFSGCSVLTDVNIPDGVTELQRSAFQNCAKLQKITVPGSVKVIESEVFAGTGVKNVEVSKDAKIGTWPGCAIIRK